MPIDGMELQKEKKPVEIKASQEAEDISVNVQNKLGNPAEFMQKKKALTDEDAFSEKKWVSDSLKKMIEEDEERKEELKKKERSKRLQKQDEKERIRLYSVDVIDTDKKRLEVTIPKKTALDFSFGKKFSDRLNAGKRSNTQQNEKSRLYKKLVAAKKLESKVSDAYDDHFAILKEMAKEVKGNISNSDLNDICQFMTVDNKNKNKNMLKLAMAGRDENGTPVVDEYHARLVLVEMANKIMDIKLDGISFNSDNNIAESADKLEKMAMQVAAFERMNGKYKFLQNIDEEKKNAIEAKLALLRPVLTYYSFRKEIIGNKEYKNHYNDELTMDISKAKTKEQKQLAKLLMTSYVVGKNMMIATGRSAKSMKELHFKDAKANEAYSKIVKDYAMANVKKYSKVLLDNYALTDDLSYMAVTMHKENLTDEVKINQPIIDDIQARRQRKEIKGAGAEEKALSEMLSSDELIPLKGTREMAALSKNIGAFMAFSSNTFSPDEVDNICTAMIMLYGRLLESADAFIKKYGSGYTEIKEMLTVITNRALEERESFREKALEYVKVAKGDPVLSKKPMTVLDVIGFTRGVYYDLDNDKDITVSVGGAGASVVYKITKEVEKTQDNPEGKEIVYFRKEDKVPSDNDMDLINEVISKYSISEELAGKLREALFVVMSNNIKNDTFRKRMETFKKVPEEDYGLALGVIADMLKDMTSIKLRVPEEEIKEVYRALIDFKDSVSKRNMANRIKLSAKIDGGRNLSDRNVATSRLATLLGIQSMICDSRTATIRMNGKLIKGNLMEDTGGEETSTSKKKVAYSPDAISQIFQMQVFDFICGQTDRHFANFHATVKDGKYAQVRCLDNDMAFGKLKAKDIDGKYYNRIIPVDDIGVCGLPVGLINKIMALDKPYLNQVLGDILNEEEIDSLMDRLNCVKSHILKVAKTNKFASWDDKNKRFTFSGEIEDERLRQLYCIQRYKNKSDVQGIRFEYICRFFGPHIEFSNIDGMINSRKAELKNAANK